jgi:hypothetical protein
MEILGLYRLVYCEWQMARVPASIGAVCRESRVEFVTFIKLQHEIAFVVWVPDWCRGIGQG